MPKKKNYQFTSKVVLWPSTQGAWHFAGVGGSVAKSIRQDYKGLSGGFGSVPVMVIVGKSEWKTSIFWDSRSNSYLLPIKAAIRRAEGIFPDDEIKIIIKIQL